MTASVTAEQIAAFHNNGFLNFGNVLTMAETAELRAALERTLSGESVAKPERTANIGGGDDSVVLQVVNIFEAEPAFRHHLYNDRIVPIVAALMGTDTVRVWHDQVQVKPPHIGGPTIWHQDFPYWPVIEPAGLISAWVALEDATIENGCMSMVRGSHKWGEYPGGTIGSNPLTWALDPTDSAFPPDGSPLDVVPCEVPAGSVVFHHCLTWHGANPNPTERNRPAIAVHYMPGETRYVPQPGKHHILENHIPVAPGEVLIGEHFPTVYENGILKSN